MSDPGDRAIDQMLEVFEWRPPAKAQPATEPFADLVDDHVPFPLVRRSRRNWWRLTLFCLLFDVAAFCAIEAMR